MPTEQNPLKVFISYSHDTPAHRLRVYELLRKLREDGIFCVTDHTMISPPEGWRAWMQDQIKNAHFTLVVCTETYSRRAERKEKPGVGLGATWEAALITDEIYRNATRNEKFIPVVFDKEDVAHIPPQLGQVSYYRVDLDDGYELLLRHLTNQPLFEEAPVAEKMRELPPINRKIEPAKLKHESNPVLLPTNATRVIRIVNAASQPGHQVHVSIELDAQGNENGFGFSLAFDAAQLGFINAMLSADAINATLNINKVQSSLGRVGLAVAFPTKQCVTSGNNKKLVTLIFDVSASSTANKMALEFGDQPINREVVNLNAGDLPVTWTSGIVSILLQQNVISQPSSQSLHQDFTEDLGDGIELKMIAIRGGAFQMGSKSWFDANPLHHVLLSPFHIGKYQITQAQWMAVMGNNPSRFKGDNLPVEQVLWTMAAEFCEKLSKQTGRNYRLPTDAEWEYACRAGSTTRYSFGDDNSLLEQYAWYGKNSGGKTHPVGEKKPNAWGLHDMHGNVWEWCQDWYARNYYKQGPEKDPQGPTSGKHRVLHGGSCSDHRIYCNSAYHGWVAPVAFQNFGCRVVCVARTS